MIYKYPHRYLTYPSIKVTSKNWKITIPIIAQLKQHIGDNLGLAANQIGWLARVILVRDVGIMINPKWEPLPNTTHKQCHEECLSNPGFIVAIHRYSAIQVIYRDKYGTKFYENFYGMPAQVIQHECDHLDGKVIGENYE